MTKVSKIIVFISAVSLLGGFAILAQAGTEHNVTGWAWSGQIGWISFNSLNTEGLPEAKCQYGDVDTQACVSAGENNCGQTASGVQTKVCKPDNSWPESWGACSAGTPMDVIFNDCEACSNCPGDCEVKTATCAIPNPVCVAPTNKVWDAECQSCAGGTVSNIANGTLCGTSGVCVTGACVSTFPEGDISVSPSKIVDGGTVTLTVSNLIDAGSDIDHYELWRQKNNEDWGSIGTYEPTISSINDSPSGAGNTYNYGLHIFNIYGNWGKENKLAVVSVVECLYGVTPNQTQSCTSVVNNYGETAIGDQIKTCQTDNTWPVSWGVCDADVPLDDVTPPTGTITAPSQVVDGDSVTIKVSDIIDPGSPSSGVKYVEIYESIDNVNWTPIQDVDPYSSGNVEVARTLTGIGNTYYYGFHVGDYAGNWGKEVTPVTVTVISGCSPLQGNTCSSPVNNCNETIAGIIQCDGTCSETTAPDNPDYLGNPCNYTECKNGITNCGPVCDFVNNKANGTSCTGGVCLDGVCDTTPPCDATCQACDATCQSKTPGGWVNYEFGHDNFSKMEIIFNWTDLPSVNATGIYPAMLHFWFESGQGGYSGPQFELNSDLTSKKKVIFSIWDMCDFEKDVGCSHTAIPLSSNCQYFGGEGTGAQCLINNATWEEDKEYKIIVEKESDAFDGSIWRGTMRDVDSGAETLIGKIKLLNTASYQGYGLLRWNVAGFFEYYSGGQNNNCLNAEYGKIIRKGPWADGLWLAKKARYTHTECLRAIRYSSGAGTIIEEVGAGVGRSASDPLTGTLWDLGSDLLVNKPSDSFLANIFNAIKSLFKRE